MNSDIFYKIQLFNEFDLLIDYLLKLLRLIFNLG